MQLPSHHAGLQVGQMNSQKKVKIPDPGPQCNMSIVSLHRFAVKGMGPDALSRVHLEPGDAFPHDREWALLKVESREKFSEQAPAWLHKENFECVFTAGEALAALETHFDDKSCTLSVRHRAQAGMVTANLQDEADVVALESFLARDVFDARPVKIVKGAGPHQFGNTHLGVKHSQDTRTIHIINASTVEEVSRAIGRPLDPMRFRANVILDGLKPWEEFEWVQRGQIQLGEVRLCVIDRSVRCEAVNIDLETCARDCDLPLLLQQHFPQHGPYLGVYAQVVGAGDMAVGDPVRVLTT